MDTMTEEKPQTGLIKIEEITSIMANAGEVLTKNENLVTAATKKGQAYLDTIEGNGMSDEIDAELNAWQVKAKDALNIMNTRRTPITQLMRQMATVFTSLEAKIDPAKPDSVYTKIQGHRNAYAKKKAEEQRVREQEILRKQNVEKEKIDIKAEVERQVRLAYQNKLYEFKAFYTNKLNSCTLENIDEVAKNLKEFKAVYPQAKFNELAVNVKAIYIQNPELAGLIFDSRSALYNELSANFNENMEELRRQLVDLLPSKKLELERIKKAWKEERERLEREAETRRLNEEAALKEEQAAAILQDQQNVELQKQVEHTGNLFDTSAQIAEVKNDSSGPVRQGYKISVKSPAGYAAIFMFWFQKEGQLMDAKDMGKKTLDQMKSFCEKHAHKTSEKVVHADVVFEEDYKAIATKA